MTDSEADQPFQGLHLLVPANGLLSHFVIAARGPAPPPR